MTVAEESVSLDIALLDDATPAYDTVAGVAAILFAAWKAGKQLPESALGHLSVDDLQEALLEFATQADLSALDESELVANHCVSMAPEWRDFISYTFLSRRGLKADMSYLRGTMIFSIINRDQLYTKPDSVISRASNFFIGCLRVLEWHGHPELRWTQAAPNIEDGEVGVGITDQFIRMRDLWLPPGLTPLRKLAGDPVSVREDEITTALVEKWRMSVGAQARIRDRNKIGLDTTKFPEAWRRRVDLECAVEMRAAIVALRALRAAAALERQNLALGSIALRSKRSPSQLLTDEKLPKGIESVVLKIREEVAKAKQFVADGELRMPRLFLRYPEAYVPEPVYELATQDPVLLGHAMVPAEALDGRDDVDMLLTSHASLQADMRELIDCYGRWHGPFAQTIEAAQFNPETGDWDILFEGTDIPDSMTEDAFQVCRWYVLPQVHRVGRRLQEGDCSFKMDGVRFFFDWWRN